jgi:nucleotide-binding universal stress UspA family protein
MAATSRAERGAAAAGPVVVAPVDGTPDGERALAYAALLARRLGARLDLVHVGPAGPPGARPRAADAGRAYVAGAAERLREAAGPPARGAHPVLLHGAPGPELLRHAEAVAACVVVLPTSGRGAVARAVLGSVALSMLRGAPCPVLVVPPDAHPSPPADWPRHVVVATDGDPRADEAFARLAGLAAPGTTGLVLTVDEPVVVSTSLLAGGGTVGGGGGAFGVAAVVARLRAAGLALAVDEVAGARPARAVADAAAARGADLVAVATHGRRGVERLFGGSVAEEVVARAACPVWVAHLRG